MWLASFGAFLGNAECRGENQSTAGQGAAKFPYQGRVAGRALPFFPKPPISWRMNYVLALFLPPLSILLIGRPILSIVVFLIWLPAIIFSGGLTHPMFILLAWILIYQAHQDRRAR
jgi:hypothetical protein